MMLTKSIKVHAVDQEKAQALCGMVQHVKQDHMENGSYLKVDCKLCQWIMNNKLEEKYSKKSV